MDQATTSFFRTAGSDPMEFRWIESRLQAELPQLQASLWPRGHANACPLTDVGEYCLRTFHLLVHFLEGPMLKGAIPDHEKTQMRHLADRDDGTVTVYLEDKKTALR
jgi:hypothetical protein